MVEGITRTNKLRQEQYKILMICVHSIMYNVTVFYRLFYHCFQFNSKYYRSMVREGIPHSLRPYIWMRLAGAMTKRANSEVSYRQIVR